MSSTETPRIALAKECGAKPSCYLDALTPSYVEVGYGSYGRQGDLGYEGKSVVVQGHRYHHALSTHAPARVVFRLAGRFTTFRCQVGFNDDVSSGVSHANFAIVADGGQACAPMHVAAGDAPRNLIADVTGTQNLELIVSTSRWEYCHSVWLDPLVDCVPPSGCEHRIVDCLARTEITVPAVRSRTSRCIATVASASYAQLLDDLLGSLWANGDCQDALVVVFMVGDGSECRRIAAKHGARVIDCTLKAKPTAGVKALLYSVARVVDGQEFICIDADMLVLQSLRPVFGALQASPADSILACREGNHRGFRDLEHVLTSIYGGRAADLTRLLGTPHKEGSYPLVVNDGLFAGTRTALLALDDVISRMPNAAAWVDERRDIGYRNQFVFNLALARMGCGVELDPTYNVQLNAQNVDLRLGGGRMEAVWNGRTARVLHFNGLGRNKYPEWRGLFARVTDPLVGPGDGDFYSKFLAALRAWVGRHGVNALAWSFYGTADAKGARVRDASVVPLLALLHYLVRANGCIRVLEAGTAKGVSAACLASAVAWREGGRVVTFDPEPHPERLELWEALPPAMSACIEQRTEDSLTGMAAALAVGEQYEAALLDSAHNDDHVWAEFKLATQLVCAGGLILIHDVRYTHGTVEQALQRVECAGYGVVRLWTADGGIKEDDHLGLALIENRRRSKSNAFVEEPS